MTRDRESIIAGGAVLGISALLFTQVLPGRFEGVALARNPLSFPRMLLLLFALGGAALVARGILAKHRHAETLAWVAWHRVLAVLVLAGVYLVLFAPAGFLAATVVFLPVVILTLGYRNWAVIALVTVLVVPGLWYLFAEAFSIRPPGFGMDDIFRAVGGHS